MARSTDGAARWTALGPANVPAVGAALIMIGVVKSGWTPQGRKIGTKTNFFLPRF
jgi:hypothetical protein